MIAVADCAALIDSLSKRRERSREALYECQRAIGFLESEHRQVSVVRPLPAGLQLGISSANTLFCLGSFVTHPKSISLGHLSCSRSIEIAEVDVLSIRQILERMDEAFIPLSVLLLVLHTVLALEMPS